MFQTGSGRYKANSFDTIVDCVETAPLWKNFQHGVKYIDEYSYKDTSMSLDSSDLRTFENSFYEDELRKRFHGVRNA